MPERFGPRLIAIAAVLAAGAWTGSAAVAEQGGRRGDGATGTISRGGSGNDGGGPPQRAAPADPGARSGRSPPDPDQDLAREAMSRGLVVPLDRILRKAADVVPGDMLDVRLRSTREGSWIYEIRMLSSDGRIRVVVIDATKNDVIEVRRP
jgi:hypothetical protein